MKSHKIPHLSRGSTQTAGLHQEFDQLVNSVYAFMQETREEMDYIKETLETRGINQLHNLIADSMVKTNGPNGASVKVLIFIHIIFLRGLV